MTAAKFLGTKIIFMDLQCTLLWSWWLKHKRKLTDHHHGPMGYAMVSMASFLSLVHESVGNVKCEQTNTWQTHWISPVHLPSSVDSGNAMLNTSTTTFHYNKKCLFKRSVHLLLVKPQNYDHCDDT